MKNKLAAALCAAGIATQVASGSERPPNIVLILADDLGYGDLGCYGATKVKTPQIDRLSEQGMRFTDAHSASAVCSPTRYGILTGIYPFRNPALAYGVLRSDSPLCIEPGSPTLPQLLKDAGYATACVGKWHLGWGSGKPDWNGELKPGPLDIGFDYYFGVPNANSMQPNVMIENRHVVSLDPADPLRVLSDVKSEGGTSARVKNEVLDTTHVEKAVTWMRGRHKANPGQPFFLYLPLVSIHNPQLAHPRFKGMNEAGMRGEYLAEHDWAAGEILAELDRLGIADNTLVVYTSDNGGLDLAEFKVPEKSAARQYGHRMNGPWRGMKSDAWEGGHRVPMIVRWPGRAPAGTVSEALVSLNDLFSTFLAAAGTAAPKSLQHDSVNQLPLFQGKVGRRDSLVSIAYQGTHALRQGNWKYIPAQGSGGITTGDGNYHKKPAFDPAAPVGQLYDLSVDSAEQNNLYFSCPEKVKEMSALLESIRNTVQ